MGNENWFFNDDNQNRENSGENGFYSYEPFNEFDNKNQKIIDLKKNKKRRLAIYLALGFLSTLIPVSYWVYKCKETPKVHGALVSEEQTKINDIISKIPEGPSLAADEIYKKCCKSVVGVLIEKEGDGFFSMPSKVQGSGVIVKLSNSSDLYILTNAHVVSGCSKGFSEISILLNSENEGEKNENREIKATLLGKDKRTDLAVLKVDEPGLMPISIGDSSKLFPGQTVYAIGSPQGLQGTITRGIVSALDRQISDDVWSTNFIQTDTAINPGNSGGALINDHGQLVGINTLKLRDSESLGFAIPINDVIKYASEIINNGQVSRPGIGVSTDDNLVIKGFARNSELKKFARIGDRIVGIDGKTVNSPSDLRKEIKKHSIGDKVSISIKDSISGLVAHENITLKKINVD